MSKPKGFLKQSKSKKKREQALDSADDFLAAGVEHEEAAGKWRAGDSTKSLRFFMRAIEVYDAGLARFPASLDLTYNKARVLLELATHPVLVAQLEVPVQDVLKEALIYHRRALELDQANADTLFNTAQVLTTLAEESINNDRSSTRESLNLLEQAHDLLMRCFHLQEFTFNESQQQRTNAQGHLEQEESDANTTVDERSDANSDNESMLEQWFSVVEPVTEHTLIETALAQLALLTTLCSIIALTSEMIPNSTLAWVEETSSDLLKNKLPRYLLNVPDRVSEVALAQANLSSALLEAAYHLGTVDSVTYKRERDAAFTINDQEMNPNLAEANARSIMAFAVALADGPNAQEYGSQRWSALAEAIKLLTLCARMPTIESDLLAKTHFLRGDCSLLQYSLSQPPTSYTLALNSVKQLLGNADIFYRNATKLMSGGKEKEVAQFRSMFANRLQSMDMVTTVNSFQTDLARREWTKSQLRNMAEEGLVPESLDGS